MNKYIRIRSEIRMDFSKPDVEQFLRSYAIDDFAVSPDENQLVFSTNLSGKYNLWSLQLPSTFPVPLTFNNQSCQELVFDKKGRFIIAGFDNDGDENTQFYALPPQGGSLKAVVYNEGTRNFFPILSEDGKKLFYSSSNGNPTYLNAYCHDLVTGEDSLISEGKEAATYFFGISSDETVQLYFKHLSNTYTLMYAKDKEEMKLLTPNAELQHTVSDAVFVTDRLIYLLTDYEADFTYLASFNLDTNQFNKVKELNKEGFGSLVYDKEQKLLYAVSNKGVEDGLYCYDLQKESWTVEETPCSVIEKITVGKSGAVYLLGRSATKPQNIYKRTDEGWVQLTNYQVPGVSESELIEPEVVNYTSFDGLEIEALFFKANAEQANGEIIFWPHGGPQASERKSFRAAFQFFLNNGYSIFAPNFRGSFGYGLSFMKMVEGDWGYGPRLDNVAGLDWLIENGYGEKGEILLMGGSYGGYMALLLHGRHADYFKAVVDIFGPSDLFSFIKSVPEDWKPVMDKWVGNPVQDKEKLIEYSPITYLDGMTRPMLVIQGANDPRVVKEESDQIVEALRQLGREVEYMLLEDEGHGFSKKENEIAVYKRILTFFQKHQQAKTQV